MPERLYFSYGSNLNRTQMQVRCPGATPLRPLALKNWRLIFKRVADIEPHPGSEVLGALWRVTRECEIALDRYEGIAHGLYRKVEFRIAATGECAFMYLMNGGEILLPGAWYHEAIAEGYRDWGFDERVLRAAVIATAAEARRHVEVIEAPEQADWDWGSQHFLDKASGIGTLGVYDYEHND